jgi:hypothetical protein
MMDHNGVSKNQNRQDDRMRCLFDRHLVAADVSRRSECWRVNGGRHARTWTTDQATIALQNPPTHVGGYGAKTICKSLIFTIFVDISGIAPSRQVKRLDGELGQML